MGPECTVERKLLATSARECEGNGCPEVERIDATWVEVQGYDPANPTRELRVRITRKLLQDAAAADR